MNTFQLSIIAALLVNLILGLVVFTSGTQRRLNQMFLVSSVVMIYWLMSLLFGARAANASTLEAWIRHSTIAGGLITVMMNGVRLSVILEVPSWRNIFIKLRLWLLAFFVVVILSQTHFFLRGAEMPVGMETVGKPIYGPGFILFALYLIGSLGVLVVDFYRDLNVHTGVKRAEIQFIILGYIGAFFVAIILTILPQATGNMELGMFLPLADFFRVGIIAYGISKVRVLDATTFIRRLIAYGMMFVFLCLVYYAVLHLSAFLLPQRLIEVLELDHLLAALATAFSVAPVHGRLQNVVGNVLFRTQQLDVGEFMQKASRELSSISTVNELVSAVDSLVKKNLESENVWVLLEENFYYVEKRVGSDDNGDKENLIVLDANSPIVLAVKEYKESLVRETLSRRRPDPLLHDASDQMKKFGIHLAAGITSKSGVEGLILLGARLSGRMYGVMELQAVEGLCGQLAVSLENAKLYTEVQNSRIYNDILLDRLVGGVIAVNTARRITVFNREAQRITGYTHEDVINKDMGALPEALRKGLEQAFKRGGSRHVDAVLEVADEEVPIQYGCTVFQGHTGEVLGALMVFSDQTELKKLQYQIRRTDRLASLGTLAAGMAHEIKNPLVSLKTFSQLLPERYEDPDFRETFSVLLGDEVQRIDRIVNQLLRFARPAKPSLSPINLHTVADNTLNLVKQQMRKHSIGVVREYHANNDSIMGDGDMLTQAMLNFLLNAIDAMGESGELILKTDVVQEKTNQLDLWGRPIQAHRLRLSIIDNGRGISEEDLHHVFDPFFTTKSSGTGLGLSVSHGIIQEHNGVIDVESEVGKGTSLHLIFPLISEEVNVEP